jgi:formate-dependent nitrite reductase cytochrome c552 subunit
MLMMVGGNRIPGIHGAHFGPGIHIRFAASDPERQTIPWVEYRNDQTGNVRTFASANSKSDALNALPKFEMQCVDCHNRPSHTFELPERAMNRALALGEISVTLPFAKKQGVELLKKTYATQKEAATQIPLVFADFYQQNYADLSAKRSEDIRQAGKAVLAIYNRNVFPELKVSWGTYPNNLGHTDFPGCFRCHDGSHTASDGQSIIQDCSTCHQALAIDEASPEILKTLGISEKIQSLQKQ